MPANQPPQPTPAKRLLVVDDESLIILVFQRILTAAGYQVEVAEDAEKALLMYGAEKYDLIITDFGLPKMDGLTLARLIKERSPRQPIILASGMLEEIKREGLNLSQVDFVLEKPFSAQQLLAALAKLSPSG